MFRAAAILLLLLAWWSLLAHLTGQPPLHNDELAIVAPGVKLWREGVFGLDMYTGFGGRETIYLEVMPLMSLLQGATTALIGLGLWQMRFLPAVAALLTLPLAAALARQLSGRRAALLTLLLLLLWQWAPGGQPYFASGIPLFDLGRLARYDILIPPLALGTALAWHRKHFAAAGLCAALAVLAQLYALALFPAVLLLWLLQSGRRLRPLLNFGAAAAAVLTLWLLIILTHWPQFTAQFGLHESRFQLFDLNFYVNNLLNEPARYFLGLSQAATLGRLGFWLATVALPLALFRLFRRWRNGDGSAQIPLVFGLLPPLLFALLLQKKQFAYLLLPFPFWAVALAAALAALSQSARWRWLTYAVVALLILEGSAAHLRLHRNPPPDPRPFLTQLDAAIPADAVILGPQTYWLARPDASYRSFVLPLLLSHAQHGDGRSLTAALNTVNPDVIVVNGEVRGWLTADRAEFDAYLQQQNAQLITELADPHGRPVQIYELR